jgi:hypothetical protein
MEIGNQFETTGKVKTAILRHHKITPRLARLAEAPALQPWFFLSWQAMSITTVEARIRMSASPSTMSTP